MKTGSEKCLINGLREARGNGWNEVQRLASA